MLYSRILGSCLGAAVGDAMGAATEVRSMEQIYEFFGGYVRSFVVPPKGTFAYGNEAGQVTDDFSQAYFLALEIIASGGSITEDEGKRALIAWSEKDDFLARFAGPTTREAIMRLKGELPDAAEDIEQLNPGKRATNGAAMRIFPVGLIHPGDLERCVVDAARISLVSHNNNLAIAGAAAIACAVSMALTEKADLFSVVRAAQYGAREGEKYGRTVGITVAGPSVEKRMELAVEIGLRSSDMEQACRDIADYVGTGLHISEAVPAAIGLLVAAAGDTMEGIVYGVNAGNDTDTVATMIGAVAGALNGVESIPEHYLSEIESKNSIDLQKLARELQQIATRESSS